MLRMTDLKVGAKDILALQNQCSLALLMIGNFHARVLCQFNICNSRVLVGLKH